MASRGFYLMSTALLGSTALLLWLAVGRDAGIPSSGSPAANANADTRVDDRALGVRAADRDSAAIRAEVAETEAPGAVLARHVGPPQVIPVPELPPPTPEELVPAPPPPVVSPELNAIAEASAAVQPQVAAAVRADLERRRSDLRKSCWPPGSDAAATFAVDASYAADGTLVALSVHDVYGLPDVSSCLMRQIGQAPPALSQPPGVNVGVTVDLAFPGSQTLPSPPAPTAVSIESSQADR